MIVTCPNCSARYRIPDAAATTRMRCAECQYRWVPGEEATEAAPLPLAGGVGGGNDIAADAPVEVDAPPAEIPTPGSASAESAPLPQAGGGSRTLATIIAIIIGVALALAAAGLWVDDATRAQLATVPGVGDLLARLDPAPSPLKITQHGQVSVTGSGARFLEVTGTLTNPTDASQPVPALAATLSDPGGVALRWTIAPPAAAIPPHGSAPFASTVTGFPPDATRLSITPN